MHNHQNPLDIEAGKFINEQAPTLLPDISEDETLAAISRIDSLISKTKELINE